MDLDSNLLKEFAKMTNDSEVKNENKYLRGTIVKNSGGKYVQLDGSTTATPISELVDVEEGDRVLVTIENHKATIVGNFSFPPSARKEQEALNKATNAETTANGVVGTANAAQIKAQEASNKADQAINQSSIASASASEAKEQAADAISKANNAQENVQEAKDLATQASADASEAKNQAAASQASSAEAQAEVTRLQGEVDAAKENVDKALEDLEAQADEIAAVKENYATKVEMGETKAELETEIVKKVGELQTTIAKDYSTKTENVELEGRLQTQITQNTEGLASQVSKTEKLESDTAKAQQDVANALSQASAAQSSAADAKAKADAAQAAANTATADAQAAASKAQLAQNAADTATAAANAADQAVQKAQGDLAEAKQNLANVTSRVDATEADIAEAQSKVDAAQSDVNEALADAAEARLAADNAQAAADKAQQDAETAQGVANTAQQKANNAQTAADNAQAAADKAQADVAALTKRVTTAETTISQNSEQIELNANKIVETGEKIDNLEIGGRNLLKDTRTPITADGTRESEYANYSYGAYFLTTSLEENKEYMISSDLKILEGAATKISVKLYDQTTTICCGEVNLSIINNRIEGVIKTNSNYNKAAKVLFYAGIAGSTKGTKIEFMNAKMEKGNKITDWSPAPEDIENNLTNNYYTKTETDAKIKVESDRISSTVSKVETIENTANAAQTAINNLEVGGRNYISHGRGNVLDGYFEKFNSIEEDDYAKVTISRSNSGYASVNLSNGFLLGCRDYEVGKQVTYSYDIMFTQWDFSEGAAIGEWAMGQRYSGAVGEATSGAWRSVTYHNLPRVGANCELNEWIHVSKVITIPEQAADGIGTQSCITLQNKIADTSISITLCIKNVKIEYGNTETDWTPAPEDISDDVNNAQNTADNAQTIATDTQTSVIEAHSLIQQLSDMIANLVTDANGTSLMTQTSTGWTFNMSSISGNLTAIQNAMEGISGEQKDTSDALTKLADLVNSVAAKTAYIDIGTDDNGDPCIELGKVGNAFKVRITNTAIDFLEGSSRIAYANNNTFYTEKMIVKNELQIGEGPGFVWRTRANGNMGLVYISG